MRKLFTAGAIASGLAFSGSAVASEPVGAVGIEAVCPATGPGAAVCIPLGLVLHELTKLANGEEAFGPNGEVMKVLVVPVEIVDANIKGTARESGEIDKVLKGATGISIKDIKHHGVFGGPNSVFRKPFG
jgi:hypothetical protein